MNTLSQYHPLAVKRELDEVRELFERWRENRKRGARIPAELWQAAVALFPRYTVNRISRALRLGYKDVRTRVENERGGGVNDYLFQEYKFSGLKGHIDGCRLRVEDEAGRKIELDLKCIETGQLLQLLGGLWGESR
jgi:hypothetical protein